jgi:uncharacterized membrane protein
LTVPRRDNLSKPRTSGGGSGYDSDAFARWAESVARFLGTGRYLAVQTIVVVVWIGINVTAGAKGVWDKYPFILLNLVFSTQAAYAAPLILLAQNRQTDRDKEEVEREADRDDLIRPLEQLTQAIERLQGVTLVDDEDALSGGGGNGDGDPRLAARRPPSLGEPGDQD